MEATRCPIWGTPATKLGGYENRDGIAVDSPRAGGAYFITRSAAVSLSRLTDKQKIALTHEIVENASVDSVANISTQTIASIPERPMFAPQERAARLLRYLIRRSEYLGQEIEFPAEVYEPQDPNVFIFSLVTGSAAAPLFAWSDSSREEEVRFLLEMLAEQKFILAPTGSAIDRITVLPAGYAQSEQDSSEARCEQAFVAMWFDASMHAAYEGGVEQAIRSCGYRPMRIDRKEHNNRIDDEIIGEIRKSRFLVADFTSEMGRPRGGVYFEAGFALGLGMPVVWTCRSDLLSDIHFDTRQFNHIVWADVDELRVGLANRILATIGAGPLYVAR